MGFGVPPAGGLSGYGGAGAVQAYTGTLGQAAASEQRSQQIASQSALTQGAYGEALTAISANGTQAQLALQQIIETLSIDADLANLASRGALELSTKALETSTLIAQYREKTFGLITTIIEQRTNNAWGRIKSLAQGFKF